MAKHRYNEHLKNVPLFADLDDHELEVVSRMATELDYDAGKVLLTEGGTAHEMFVVMEGTLEVTRGGEHIADIGPGGFAGEMALLTHSHRNSTVTAKTDTLVLHIDGRGFASVLHEVPEVAVKMLPIIAARAVAMSDDHTH
ncbi:MAG: cyclic nucleotide-binding domain-containing protein [Ilumatobacter sp.]|uniref:cyclic nucleotide-binding domain-containing protein n=1 Tax=Ilumatobacter sp. TaxID=1967498 RepID=UPI0026342E56|nr:cyclic nucleotide-binding domain-containing protein [Ilumatobacter sp.]MDJ0767973.1 cyclic nucleotide-binding domain-containing protein [Ilumatobacter sp.]